MDDDEERCPGEAECDYGECDQLVEYEVTWSYEVVGQVRAHSEDQAQDIADDVSFKIRLELPDDTHDFVDSLTVETDGDTLIESVREKQARQYAMRVEMERLVAEGQVTADQ